jgi:hypothetical protein
MQGIQWPRYYGTEIYKNAVVHHAYPEMKSWYKSIIGVKPLIHQSELGTYTKVVPFQEKSSFHFVVL